MTWMKLMGPPVNKGPEAHDVAAGHPAPAQRTMKEMKLFWEPSALLHRGHWRSLRGRLEEEEEGRSLELHSEEQCGIKSEHLELHATVSLFRKGVFWTFWLYINLCSTLFTHAATGAGWAPGSSGPPVTHPFSLPAGQHTHHHGSAGDPTVPPKSTARSLAI